MSGTIHVNTELMRELGRRFQENCEIARVKMIAELQSVSAQMEGDWVGISRTLPALVPERAQPDYLGR